jgi:hypothetical protein
MTSALGAVAGREARADPAATPARSAQSAMGVVM